MLRLLVSSFGMNLIPTRYELDVSKVSTWIELGLNVVKTGLKLGLNLGQTWFKLGLNLVQPLSKVPGFAQARQLGIVQWSKLFRRPQRVRLLQWSSLVSVSRSS